MEAVATSAPITRHPDLFLNHFFALDYHIQRKDDLESLAKAPLFKRFQASNTHVESLAKLLTNAWSAEYALRITPVVNDEQYLQSSLHWTFPQAYYSVLFSARAFLSVQGVNISEEGLIRKQIGSRVMRGFYPQSVGFYASGIPGQYTASRLPLADKHSTAPDADTLYSRTGFVQAELSRFLTDTRDKRIKELARLFQLNPKTALRCPRTGELSRVFSDEQNVQLARPLGYTTYFDLLSRLRISSTNREIERFVDSDIDVRQFHQSLVNIVSHINAVHEAYIAKGLGLKAYKQIVARLPMYLHESFVSERTNTQILPLFD